MAEPTGIPSCTLCGKNLTRTNTEHVYNVWCCANCSGVGAAIPAPTPTPSPQPLDPSVFASVLDGIRDGMLRLPGGETRDELMAELNHLRTRVRDALAPRDG